MALSIAQRLRLHGTAVLIAPDPTYDGPAMPARFDQLLRRVTSAVASAEHAVAVDVRRLPAALGHSQRAFGSNGDQTAAIHEFDPIARLQSAITPSWSLTSAAGLAIREGMQRFCVPLRRPQGPHRNPGVLSLRTHSASLAEFATSVGGRGFWCSSRRNVL